MATRRAVLRGVIGAALWSPAAVAPAMAASTAQALRTIPPSIVVIGPDVAEHVRQRPAVEFDHDRHTAALAPLRCETCHRILETGALDPRFAAAVEADRWDRRMDAFHGECIGCHAERSRQTVPGGPVTCGECHVRRPPGRSARVEMGLDLSLHGRHANAYPEKCETCHHVFDPETKVLVYRKGTEAACRTCHQARAVESTPSRAEASHRGCVSCHLKLVEAEAAAGPVTCSGCHDAGSIAGLKRLEEIPRLLRGQSDRLWVAAADGAWPAVPFDHLFHEPQVSSCSGCHHATLEPCDVCHTLRGASAGAGVTLAETHHDPRSAHSCVGCHRRQAGRVECRGCHAGGAGATSERSCTVCHSGPEPKAVAGSAMPAERSRLEAGELPSSPEDLPEEVVIDILVDRYEASRLPHGKIVRRLHAAVVDSALARRFHGGVEVGCSGCHHHSPVGERPPRCASCHGEVGDPTRDRPGLKAAYHRQCLECHEQMGIKAVGCTDCHALREVQS